jgi:phosphoglycerate dehydrogenase-like enzyme
MSKTFRIGVSSDFYTEAREAAEGVIRDKFAGAPGIEVVPMPAFEDHHSTPEVLQQFDAIFAMATRVNEAGLRGVTRLACVARWGVGYDRIDTDALTAHDVALTITPNSVKRPVAEAIFTFALALAKNLPTQDRITRSGRWRGDLPKLGVSLAGKTLGSVGCGNIGQEMFRMSQSFNFGRRLACDPNVQKQDVASLGVELVDMDTVFRESDFVTVNVLLNKSTEGLIREHHFRLMKPAAFFINTARGPIVEHSALVKALREHWIAGAGIDVFPVEPTPKDDPLFTLDNCILAPHAMAWTNELMRENGYEASDCVLAVARGEVPPAVVNRAVLDRPGFRAKLERFR